MLASLEMALIVVAARITYTRCHAMHGVAMPICLPHINAVFIWPYLKFKLIPIFSIRLSRSLFAIHTMPVTARHATPYTRRSRTAQFSLRAVADLDIFVFNT